VDLGGRDGQLSLLVAELASHLWPLVHYRLQGFPIASLGQVTQSPGHLAPPPNFSFRKLGLPCSTMAHRQHAHNGGVGRADLRPSRLPTRYQVIATTNQFFLAGQPVHSLVLPRDLPTSALGRALHPSPSAPLAPNLLFFSLYHTIRLYDIDVRYSLPERVRSKFPSLDIR